MAEEQSQQFHKECIASVGVSAGLEAKARRPGFSGGPFLKLRQGLFLQASGKWAYVERVIDRLKKWYHEKVVDPETKEVLHERDEPLPEHIGHGSDRPEFRNRDNSTH